MLQGPREIEVEMNVAGNERQKLKTMSKKTQLYTKDKTTTKILR